MASEAAGAVANDLRDRTLNRSISAAFSAFTSTLDSRPACTWAKYSLRGTAMWIMIANAGWVLAAALSLWMLYDWFRVDTTYSEDVLTSSREGEIEAVQEKHRV